MTFTPFPEIKTSRLLLRQILNTDSDAILYLRSDKIINQHIQRPPESQTNTIADALKHIKKLTDQIDNNTSISWGITLKDQHEVIGTICLWNFSDDNLTAEVGYDLSLKHQNKGIMTEALFAVLEFGFNSLSINKIEAYTQKQNTHSIKLLEKTGFILNPSKKDTHNADNLVFEKLNSI